MLYMASGTVSGILATRAQEPSESRGHEVSATQPPDSEGNSGKEVIISPKMVKDMAAQLGIQRPGQHCRKTRGIAILPIDFGFASFVALNSLSISLFHTVAILSFSRSPPSPCS